ncbi:MAG: PAS-domain containing protein [Gammaproteobacteria bacterium]|nr:PAS-domain containing protein [Gammaproteobacteria bacterium]
MLSTWSLITTALAYMGLLFAIAWIGDRKRIARDHRNIQAVIYSLSLAVYCTSWTFYGAVGSAATTGWGYLPIYLGPALLMLFGFDLLRRIATISHHQRITSIADFIAHRYDRSHSIAVLVTLAAVIGSVPYIALQFKGITNGFNVVAGSVTNDAALPGELSLYVALTLALFATLFGTRTLDASEHHRGLMWAIAFESLVKLLAFLAIGLFVIFGIFGGFSEVAATVRENQNYQELFSPWRLPEGFGIQLVLAMTAILCLPRQFHVAIVEFRDIRELKTARWLFPSYLAVFAILAMPIALAGLVQFGGQDVHPDSYVLALPIAFDKEALTVLAFLGGFSAASGMVIVATVALAIMVSNDIVMPLLLRSGMAGVRGETDLSRTLLRVRRISIVAISLLAYAYYQAIEAGVPLASIGLLSFSAAAQFAPAMLIGLYWPGANRAGALSGLTVGVGGWFVLLLLPSLAGSEATGLPDVAFNQGAAWSLALNALAVVVVSLMFSEDTVRRRKAEREEPDAGLITLGELENTLGRFLGRDSTRRALETHLHSNHLEADALATPATVQFGERLLAGSIGSASARSVLTTALHHRGLGPEAVFELLNQTSQAVQFNRELLQATLDNMSQGVAVIDKDLQLVGWNQSYLELMNYPDGMVYLGQPVEELIRHNATRGLIRGGTSEAAVRKRLDLLRGGDPYRFERSWPDGSVIEIQGNPLPGGGYVTTFSNITHFKTIASELKLINETLEQRVRQRTQELSEANADLEEARKTAESANRSKTRFLAAASHDLLQPINAARLFVSILRQQAGEGGDEEARLVKRVDRSLTAAEELLGALLDISKLDSGMYEPDPEVIEVSELFEQLRRRFQPLAANRDLQLRVRGRKDQVFSDRNLLYRILQNFLSNAIRYTESGGVLLSCQRRGDHLRFRVSDTGVGIAEDDSRAIFQEFHRLDYAHRLEEKGLGLGLAICDRIAHMLGHRMEVRSRPGHGSTFSVTVPLASRERIEAQRPKDAPRSDHPRLQGLAVLCIDNEADILEGMNLLLDRWGCTVLLAQDREQAVQRVKEHGPPGMVLVDHHLSQQVFGLDVMAYLEELLGKRLPTIVITADRSPELEEEVRRMKYGLLRKPIKPAALRALMTNTLKNR